MPVYPLLKSYYRRLKMATLEEVTKVMVSLLPLYPHAPHLTKAHYQAYQKLLRDLPFAVLDKAAWQAAANSPKFYPTAMDLRNATFELMEDASALPTEDEAWAEVSKSFGPYGRYRGAPEWSHELIGYAIDAVGGYIPLCASENAVADRAHFKQAYRGLRERHRNAQRALPEVREAIARLAAGMQPQLGAGDD
jgi:hypothetical protein